VVVVVMVVVVMESWLLLAVVAVSTVVMESSLLLWVLSLWFSRCGFSFTVVVEVVVVLSLTTPVWAAHNTQTFAQSARSSSPRDIGGGGIVAHPRRPETSTGSRWLV